MSPYENSPALRALPDFFYSDTRMYDTTFCHWYPGSNNQPARCPRSSNCSSPINADPHANANHDTGTDNYWYTTTGRTLR